MIAVTDLVSRSRRSWSAISLLLTFSICIGVLFRYQIANNFTILHGDRYDMVIVATILEHWYHVFRGEAQWSNVAYFYPYARTIAQTDAYFLVGIAYAPFRQLGLDPFLATEMAGIVLKGIGFWGAWWMSRRVFNLSFGWALLIGALFTLNNAMTVHAQRLQLATVAFAPVLVTILYIALSAFLERDSRRFRWYGAGAGLILGMWCMSCFYMAWFFSFFFTVLLFGMLVLGRTSGLKTFGSALRAQYWSLLFVLLVTAAAMAPFILAFLPKSLEVGVRSYETVAANTIRVANVLQVGTENLLFGRIYNALLAYTVPGYHPNGEYYNTGISPAVFFLFGCGVATMLRRDGLMGTFVPRAVAMATVVAWVLALNVNGYSAWYYVYRWFPGAQALNVVSALQIFLALPVLAIAVLYLSRATIARPVLLLVIGFLLFGELNKSHQDLDRHAEIERIRLAEPPPKECQAFYVSGWRGQDDIPGFPVWVNNFYAHNVSAMLIAQYAGIPTLNGVASFNPKDWNFGFPNTDDYDSRVMAFARKHGVGSVCKLDLNSKIWTVAEAAAQR